MDSSDSKLKPTSTMQNKILQKEIIDTKVLNYNPIHKFPDPSNQIKSSEFPPRFQPSSKIPDLLKAPNTATSVPQGIFSKEQSYEPKTVSNPISNIPLHQNPLPSSTPPALNQKFPVNNPSFPGTINKISDNSFGAIPQVGNEIQNKSLFKPPQSGSGLSFTPGVNIHSNLTSEEPKKPSLVTELKPKPFVESSKSPNFSQPPFSTPSVNVPELQKINKVPLGFDEASKNPIQESDMRNLIDPPKIENKTQLSKPGFIPPPKAFPFEPEKTEPRVNPSGIVKSPLIPTNINPHINPTIVKPPLNLQPNDSKNKSPAFKPPQSNDSNSKLLFVSPSIKPTQQGVNNESNIKTNFIPSGNNSLPVSSNETIESLKKPSFSSQESKTTSEQAKINVIKNSPFVSSGYPPSLQGNEFKPSPLVPQSSLNPNPPVVPPLQKDIPQGVNPFKPQNLSSIPLQDSTNVSIPNSQVLNPNQDETKKPNPQPISSMINKSEPKNPFAYNNSKPPGFFPNITPKQEVHEPFSSNEKLINKPSEIESYNKAPIIEYSPPDNTKKNPLNSSETKESDLPSHFIPSANLSKFPQNTLDTQINKPLNPKTNPQIPNPNLNQPIIHNPNIPHKETTEQDPKLSNPLNQNPPKILQSNQFLNKTICEALPSRLNLSNIETNSNISKNRHSTRQAPVYLSTLQPPSLKQPPKRPQESVSSKLNLISLLITLINPEKSSQVRDMIIKLCPELKQDYPKICESIFEKISNICYCNFCKKNETRFELSCSHKLCQNCANNNLINRMHLSTLPEFGCPLCHKKISYQDLENIYPKDKISEKYALEKSLIDKALNVYNVICAKCKKPRDYNMFYNKTCLHMCKECIATNIRWKKYECDYCGSNFGNNDEINNEKKYCDGCKIEVYYIGDYVRKMNDGCFLCSNCLQDTYNYRACKACLKQVSQQELCEIDGFLYDVCNLCGNEFDVLNFKVLMCCKNLVCEKCSNIEFCEFCAGN
ncbi:hypothetical protein SteCoe_4173 [Stentor coeruleus]|uniref:RING-type domain-containing protein n=1 Tax=Stentor coeruleus TaxID=5963 RepID=A0A1R2CVE7_9CILI|nr:hypothetical protein SteCoe_4173 [Stentor coeruleus]